MNRIYFIFSASEYICYCIITRTRTISRRLTRITEKRIMVRYLKKALTYCWLLFGQIYIFLSGRLLYGTPIIC